MRSANILTPEEVNILCWDHEHYVIRKNVWTQEQEAKKCFASYDASGNGTIDFAELFAVCQLYCDVGNLN